MPADVAIVTAAIGFVFIIFAAVLAWGDDYANSEKRAKKDIRRRKAGTGSAPALR